MAEVPFELIGQVENSTTPNGTVLVTWPNMQAGDTGQPYSGHSYTDRSVQVAGDFGASGNCRVAGSNDGSTYVALSDPQGDVLNLTAPALTAVTEISRYIRPEITAGDGTTNVTVTLIGRR